MIKKYLIKVVLYLFILTDNYKPTSGCIALKEKDFEILLKLIKNNSKIKIG